MTASQTPGPDQQRDVLEAAVADFLARTRGRVAFSGQSRVVVLTRHPVNHVLHLVLTLITGGLWLLPWVLISIGGREDAHTITIADDGAATVTADGARTTTGGVRGIRGGGFRPRGDGDRARRGDAGRRPAPAHHGAVAGPAGRGVRGLRAGHPPARDRPGGARHPEARDRPRTLTAACPVVVSAPFLAHLQHPDNRCGWAPEAQAEAARVMGGKRETRSRVSDRDPR